MTRDQRGPIGAAIVGLLAAGACAKTATPTEPTRPAPVVSPAPSAPSAEPAPAEPRADEREAEEPVGVPQCDRYLERYRDCAAELAGAIAAGDRRAYPSERAWLLHMKSSSEAPNLPAACDEMLRELERVCR